MDVNHQISRIIQNGSKSEDWLALIGQLNHGGCAQDLLKQVYTVALNNVCDKYSNGHKRLLVGLGNVLRDISIDEARETFKKACFMDCECAIVCIYLAQFELQCGEMEEARRILNAGRTDGRSPKRLLEKAYRNLLEAKPNLFEGIPDPWNSFYSDHTDTASGTETSSTHSGIPSGPGSLSSATKSKVKRSLGMPVRGTVKTRSASSGIRDMSKKSPTEELREKLGIIVGRGFIEKLQRRDSSSSSDDSSLFLTPGAPEKSSVKNHLNSVTSQGSTNKENVAHKHHKTIGPSLDFLDFISPYKEKRRSPLSILDNTTDYTPFGQAFWGKQITSQNSPSKTNKLVSASPHRSKLSASPVMKVVQQSNSSVNDSTNTENFTKNLSTIFEVDTGPLSTVSEDGNLCISESSGTSAMSSSNSISGTTGEGSLIGQTNDVKTSSAVDAVICLDRDKLAEGTHEKTSIETACSGRITAASLGDEISSSIEYEPITSKVPGDVADPREPQPVQVFSEYAVVQQSSEISGITEAKSESSVSNESMRKTSLTHSHELMAGHSSIKLHQVSSDGSLNTSRNFDSISAFTANDKVSTKKSLFSSKSCSALPVYKDFRDSSMDESAMTNTSVLSESFMSNDGTIRSTIYPASDGENRNWDSQAPSALNSTSDQTKSGLTQYLWSMGVGEKSFDISSNSSVFSTDVSASETNFLYLFCPPPGKGKEQNSASNLSFTSTPAVEKVNRSDSHKMTYQPSKQEDAFKVPLPPSETSTLATPKNSSKHTPMKRIPLQPMPNVHTPTDPQKYPPEKPCALRPSSSSFTPTGTSRHALPKRVPLQPVSSSLSSSKETKPALETCFSLQPVTHVDISSESQPNKSHSTELGSCTVEEKALKSSSGMRNEHTTETRHSKLGASQTEKSKPALDSNQINSLLSDGLKLLGQKGFNMADRVEDIAPVSKRSRTLEIHGKKYAARGLIGKGGSCKVFEVFSDDGCTYALKRVRLQGLEESVRECYLNEIGLLEKLRGSPYIIHLYDWDFRNDYLLMVLEKGDSDLLRVLRDRSSPLPANVIRKIWRQALIAVQAIHDEGIVHTDLKPANFLFVGETLKLIDFGIANILQADKSHVTRASMGTANYMAPETIGVKASDSEASKVSRASDVWSLGCILYYMVYKKTPYQDIHNNLAKMAAIWHGDAIQFPPIDDDQLLDCLKGCLKHEKVERYTIPQLLNHPFLVKT